MRIDKIYSTPNNIRSNSTKGAKQNNVSKQMSPAFTSHPIINKEFGGGWFHIQIMDKLRQQSALYPEDKKYKENLMINSGLHPEDAHKIVSIAGPEETKRIMSAFNNTPEVYSNGTNWHNVNYHVRRANLHMHTKASDGALTVHELLDKAVDYANSVASDNDKKVFKEPVNFVIGITDHDTTESASEAVKIISESPFKYRNLKVILGSEVTTFNNIAPDITGAPTNVHTLTMAIDPNEEYYKSFIDTTKEKKFKIENMMVEKANKTYHSFFGKEDFFNLNQAKRQYNPLNKNIIGIFNNLDEYFKNKIAIEHVILKDEKLSNALNTQGIHDTNSFMEKLREFHKPLDENNKVMPPQKTLPDFISIMTGIEKEEVSEILDKGLNNEKISALNKTLKSDISEFKVTLAPKYDYMPAFKTVYDGLKGQDDAVVGLAHPLNYIKTVPEEEKKYEFLTELYSKFKAELKEKAKFSEVYYQSYKPDREVFNQKPETKKFMNFVSKLHKLYKTGGHDTHGVNIFLR